MSQAINEALSDVLDRVGEIEDLIDGAEDFDSALDLTQNLIDEVETLRAALRKELS